MHAGVGALLLLACAVVSQCAQYSPNQSLLSLAQSDPKSAFNSWLSTHQKKYAGDLLEFGKRFDTWKANVAFIRQYNDAHSASHHLDLNEFADLTYEEFASSRLGLSADLLAKKSQSEEGVSNKLYRYAAVDPPANIDWREKGAVTPVKNQGACGSCWAFSATGAVEGVNAVRTGKLTALSEQELVDCDTEFDQGCGGGLMDYAFKFIKENGGIDTEKDYGYYSSWGFGTWCNGRKKADRTVVTIDGFEDVPKNDENALKQAVANHPVAVGICANSALQFYKGGILDTCCEGLNHGVLAVGYDTDASGTPYWIIKNSWGEGWGEEGFFRLKYGVGKTGLCGVATTASYPVKEETFNKPVPKMCDVFAWQECPAGSSCSCNWSFFGLFCITHDCCPHKNGATCSDLRHCCPSDYPVCNTEEGACYKEDGKTKVDWTDKSKASSSSPNLGTQATRPRKVLPS